MQGQLDIKYEGVSLFTERGPTMIGPEIWGNFKII